MALRRKDLQDIEGILRSIKDVLCDIADSPQEESLEPILYCDDDCNITGAVAFIRDEETTEVIPVYFDANLAPSATSPDGSPCGPKCGLDYEIIENCYEDADNIKYKQLIAFTFKQGQKEQTDICWILPDGSVVETQPDGITPCDVDCNPAIADVTVQEGGFIPFTQGSVSTLKPCCTVEVETNVGTFFLRQGMQNKSIGPFECPVEIQSVNVTGDCLPSEVFIHLENKGCNNCLK
jgi:hypothetical protein